MSTQKHCPGCGTAVTSGQAHCPRCGKDLTALAGPTATGGIGAQASPQPSSGTRPWPFSDEILAQQLAAQNFMPKHVVDALAAEAASSRRSLPQLILERKQMSQEALRDAMSRIFGLPVADLRAPSIDPALIAQFPAEAARNNLFLPLYREDTRLLMVVADPTQAQAVREVKNTLRLTIDLRLATPNELAPIVHQYFSPTLVVLLPSGETFTVPLTGGELKIGKAEHNDIVLPDPAVSGTHGVLRANATGFQIVDLASRNGIYVDNVRVEGSRTLKNGDVITIGQCLLTFKLPVPVAAAIDGGGTQILRPGQIPNALRGVGPVAASPVAGGMAAIGAPPVVVPGTVGDDKGEKKGKKKKKEKEKEKEKGKESEKLKSAWIGFVGRILAQIVGAIATIILGLAVAGKLSCGPAQGGGAASSALPPGVEEVAPTLFGENNPQTKMEYNASGIVPLGDSRFLFVENNTNDALFELQLNPDGSKAGPVTRRPLAGLAAGAVDDMEGLTLAEENGSRYAFAITSMMTKKKRGIDETPPSGLLRISFNPDGSLQTEVMSDFRDWFIRNEPTVGSSAILEPDEGGLNVEGLAWDPKRKALLLGVRTPVQGGRPLIVPVRIKDLAGPWTSANLELLPAIKLGIENAGEQGVRAIEYDASRNAFLIVVGNSTSLSSAPFQLYLWDGNDAGTVTRVKNVGFGKKMKPEGIAHGTVGGKPSIVITDDAGGFVVLADDDPRLKG